MVVAAKKMTFPVVPTAHWFALRKKFQQTIPGIVTPNYVASVLKMQEDSARANVLPGLKLAKIIDEEGKPSERARKWRDDAQYAAVCNEILEDAYPQELRDAVPDPAKDRAGAARWFANHTGGGEAAVTKMVSFYSLLCKADLNAQRNSAEKSTPTEAVRSRRTQPRAGPPKAQPRTNGESQSGGAKVLTNSSPSVHINLQIHISADASTDQIDQVFASMAKHLYAGGVK